MSKFKFGDMVYFPSNVEEIGVVIEVKDNKIVVAWNDLMQTTESVDDIQLTIIPHPDTMRLNFLLENQLTVALDDNTERFCVVAANPVDNAKISGSGVFMREAIDAAMAALGEPVPHEAEKNPVWFQAAIAKLTEKYNEKRQEFEWNGDRYHDGFADGLDTAETIFKRELEKCNDK